eukprot:6803085-Prymnesium_polylepis.2
MGRRTTTWAFRLSETAGVARPQQRGGDTQQTDLFCRRLEVSCVWSGARSRSLNRTAGWLV